MKEILPIGLVYLVAFLLAACSDSSITFEESDTDGDEAVDGESHSDGDHSDSDDDAPLDGDFETDGDAPVDGDRERICEPGALRCASDAPDVVEQCRDDGLFWEWHRECARGLRCFEGVCFSTEPDGDVDEDAEGCAHDDDCVGAYCLITPGNSRGVCTEACGDAVACPGGMACRDGRCEALPDYCESTDDCEMEDYCWKDNGAASGYCVRACDLDGGSCPLLYDCATEPNYPGSGRCVRNTNHCLADADCVIAEEYCDRDAHPDYGFCTHRCAADTDCYQLSHCVTDVADPDYTHCVADEGFCLHHADCGENELCHMRTPRWAGLCLDNCLADDVSCAEGWICTDEPNPFDGLGLCRPQQDRCNHVLTCLEADYCRWYADLGEGYCSQLCSADADCWPGEVCYLAESDPLSGSCHAPDTCPGTCWSDSLCPAGLYCDLDQSDRGCCTPGCRSNAECGAQERCDDSHACVPGCTVTGCPDDQVCDTQTRACVPACVNPMLCETDMFEPRCCPGYTCVQTASMGIKICMTNP